MTRVAVYARSSSDRDGNQTSTDRQVVACRLLAEARCWEESSEYVDVDLSAYKAVTRPRYEALLAAIRGGEIDGVVVWKLDRLVRRVVEFERSTSRPRST